MPLNRRDPREAAERFKNRFAKSLEILSRGNEMKRDDTPAHIITHEGREYDLTNLETPFGLLPEPVQEALKAWPHGAQYYGVNGDWKEVSDGRPSLFACRVYRAKPAPAEVRVRCKRYAIAADSTPIEHGTCVKRADGSIDWPTWEPQP